MNVVGIVFAGVAMFALLFFGLGTSQSLVQEVNITASDEMSGSYNTTLQVSTQTFEFMGYLPYLIFLVGLLLVLLMFTKLSIR